MIRYVPLEAVFNYLPKLIMQDVDSKRIESWTYQVYRDYELPFSEELKTALITVTNHKAPLPVDVRRIAGVNYSPSQLESGPDLVLQDYGEYRLIVYQEIFFGSQYYRDTRPLSYKGQMREAIIDQQLYCSDCEIGFTVDKSVTCLTIDLMDGEITLVYFAPVQEAGQLMIPDDTALLQGLSWSIQANYWLEKAYSHEESAYKFHNDALIKAAQFLSKFKGKRLLRAVNPTKHNALVFGRNRPAFDYARNRRLFR